MFLKIIIILEKLLGDHVPHPQSPCYAVPECSVPELVLNVHCTKMSLIKTAIDMSRQAISISKRFNRKRNLREPIGTTTLNKLWISLATFKLITFRSLIALLVPLWPGYWHDRRGLQHFPSLCLCRRHTIILSIWLDETWKKPDLYKINWYSFISLQLRDKWQLWRWLFISSLHSSKGITFVFPRDAPQISEHLSLAKLHWTNDIVTANKNAASRILYEKNNSLRRSGYQ